MVPSLEVEMRASSSSKLLKVSRSRKRGAKPPPRIVHADASGFRALVQQLTAGAGKATAEEQAEACTAPLGSSYGQEPLVVSDWTTRADLEGFYDYTGDLCLASSRSEPFLVFSKALPSTPDASGSPEVQNGEAELELILEEPLAGGMSDLRLADISNGWIPRGSFLQNAFTSDRVETEDDFAVIREDEGSSLRADDDSKPQDRQNDNVTKSIFLPPKPRPPLKQPTSIQKSRPVQPIAVKNRDFLCGASLATPNAATPKCSPFRSPSPACPLGLLSPFSARGAFAQCQPCAGAWPFTPGASPGSMAFQEFLLGAQPEAVTQSEESQSVGSRGSLLQELQAEGA